MKVRWWFGFVALLQNDWFFVSSRFFVCFLFKQKLVDFFVSTLQTWTEIMLSEKGVNCEIFVSFKRLIHLIYLQVYCSMRSWQISHWTSQHHLNLHRHCHRFWNWWILWPRPQHKRSQLSRPCAVKLHGRSTVPNDPMLKFRSQYCGDGSKCISSERFGISYLRRLLWIDVVRSGL